MSNGDIETQTLSYGQLVKNARTLIQCPWGAALSGVVLEILSVGSAPHGRGCGCLISAAGVGSSFGCGVLRRMVEILGLLSSGYGAVRQFVLGGVIGATMLASTFGGLTPASPGDRLIDPDAGTSTELVTAVERRDLATESKPSAAKQVVLDSGRTPVPYITQFDGTPWEGSNCGIASIAMVLSAFDITLPTVQVRKSIISITGDPSYDAGVAWDPLVKIAWRHNFPVNGPNNADGSLRHWFLEELDAESRMGRPSILLVHYRSLPGHEHASWWGDHYVVFLGLTANGDVIYHDPAFRGSAGAYRVTDRATFERAWTSTMSGQQRTAIVVGW